MNEMIQSNQRHGVLLAPDNAEVPPSLTPLEDVSVVEGSPVQFRTLVNGTPMPTVQWLREGQVIPPSTDFQVINERRSQQKIVS